MTEAPLFRQRQHTLLFVPQRGEVSSLFDDMEGHNVRLFAVSRASKGRFLSPDVNGLQCHADAVEGYVVQVRRWGAPVALVTYEERSAVWWLMDLSIRTGQAERADNQGRQPERETFTYRERNPTQPADATDSS